MDHSSEQQTLHKLGANASPDAKRPAEAVKPDRYAVFNCPGCGKENPDEYGMDGDIMCRNCNHVLAIYRQ